MGFFSNLGERRRVRAEVHAAAAERAFRTLTFESSVLMTMAQASRAMGESGEASGRDRDVLATSILATAVRHGYEPSLPEDHPKRLVFQLLASELGQDPNPTFTSLGEWIAAGSPYNSMPPRWVYISGSSDTSQASGVEQELRRLTFTHHDDMNTMFVRQLAGNFGVDDPEKLDDEDRIVLLHAGYTLVTVCDDVKDSSADEAEARTTIACRFEAGLIDQAVRSSQYRSVQQAEQRAQEAKVRQSGAKPEDFRKFWSWTLMGSQVWTSPGRSCIKAWEFEGTKGGYSRLYLLINVEAAPDATAEQRREIAERPWEVVSINLGADVLGRYKSYDEAFTATETYALEYSYRSARGEA